MSESNQEGYQTLGWIMNKSEYGLFLVVADETIQKEIISIYRQGMIGIYDYKEHPESYSFHSLKKWIDTLPEIQTFLIVNFQFAVQSEDDLKRLNFSRDMLAGLGKNLIFFTTLYGDDMLAGNAFDFYSFIKIRVIFHEYKLDEKKKNLELDTEEDFIQDKEYSSEELRQQLSEADSLLKYAEEAEDNQEYQKSEMLLLKAMEIRKKILGSEHLEMAVIYHKLAAIREKQGNYVTCEELCKKALSINERVLGENNPDTANVYNSLAGLYERQGRYKEAEKLYQKALFISEKVLGENHPTTAFNYNDLAYLYERQGKYKEAEELYKKSLSISEKILGKSHSNTATNYNNLAALYTKQGRYKEAEELYQKSLLICEKILGENHPNTAANYNNLALLYDNQKDIKKQRNYIKSPYPFVKKY